MKIKKLCAVACLIVVCGLIFGSVYMYNKSIDNAYNDTVDLVRSGSYEEALAEFENTNPEVLDRDDFKFNINSGDLGECYKNTVYLYSYALARFEYDSEDKYMRVINDYLNFIPSNYNGELSEEISKFKESFKPLYDEYLAEEERKAEEERIEREKREKEFVASLRKKIPYEGMSEKYINSTAAGSADKHESEYVKARKSKPGYELDKYYWKSNDNKDTVLFVECRDGRVTKVTKYYESTYWTKSGMPMFWATRSKATTQKKSSTKKKEDPYNVNDYSDPEDFYEDNYDDFWDYEDAEDYYNEHYDD